MQCLFFALGFPLKKNDSAKFKENEDNNFSSNQCRMSLCQYELQSFKTRDAEFVRLLPNLLAFFKVECWQAFKKWKFFATLDCEMFY